MDYVFKKPEKLKEKGLIRMRSDLQSAFKDFKHGKIEELKNDICDCLKDIHSHQDYVQTKNKATRDGKHLWQQFKEKHFKRLIDKLQKKWNFNEAQLDNVKLICQTNSSSSAKSKGNSLQSLSSIRSITPTLSKESNTSSLGQKQASLNNDRQEKLPQTPQFLNDLTQSF